MERTYNEQERRAFYTAENELRARGLIVDEADGATEMNHNAETLLGYFERHPETVVSTESLLRASEELRQQLYWLSPIQQEYRKLKAENPAAAQAVAQWLQTQNQLVKHGEEGLQNQIVIMDELRGRDVTQLACQQALGRASYNGKLLHFVPTPARIDPRQHADDGEGFMPKRDEDRRYVGGRKNHRLDPQPEQATPAPASPKTPDAFENLCHNLLRHGTHGCQAAMRELFDRRGSKSWRELWRDMNQVKQSYERLVRY